MRRVVTGHKAGKSVFLETGPPSQVLKMNSLPGMEIAALWATGKVPAVPGDGADPTLAPASGLPRPGETSFGFIRLPGTAEIPPDFEPAAFGREFLAKAPALAACFEAENPGMHTTATIDYVIVVSGEVWLELDDGQEVRVEAGDVVVQQGTRHAWRNRSAEGCVLAAVMIGAEHRR